MPIIITELFKSISLRLLEEVSFEAPSSFKPVCLRFIISSYDMKRIFCLKIAPIVALMVFGLYISAQPSVRIMQGISKAHAVRIIVPTLPGSWMLSSKMVVAFEKLKSDCFGILHENRTPCGFFRGETESIKSVFTL